VKRSIPGINRLIYPFFLIVIIALVYIGSFQGVFIYDDFDAIIENPTISSLSPWWGPFFPGSSTTMRDRPLVNFTFALNYYWGGFALFGYHLVNLSIHLGAALCLYYLVLISLSSPRLREKFGNAARGLSWLIALIWAIHPLQTESVTYINQRSESLAGLCYLLVVLFAVRSFNSPRPWILQLGAIAFSALGLACKATVITAPVAVLLLDRFLYSGSWRGLYRHRGLYAGLLATWLVFLLISSMTSYPDIKSHGAIEYALNQPRSILYYLRLTFFPAPLSLDYGWKLASKPGSLIFPLIVTFALLILTLRAILRNKLWSLPLAWFFLLLAPTTSFFPLEDLFFEHWIYLALAGPISLVVVSFYLLTKKLPVYPRLAACLSGCLLVCVLLAALTWRRNMDYSSEVGMWESVVGLNPTHVRGYNNLGRAWERKGNQAQALACYRKALLLEPGNPEASGNLLNLSGTPEQRLEFYQRLVADNPDSALARYNLGVAMDQMGKPGAAGQYREAIQLRPSYDKAWFSLGTAYYRRGELKEAAECFEKALEVSPGYEKARHNLEVVRAAMGN